MDIKKSINRKIGRAMADYSMLDNGDRVLVAVSGGVDSLFTACLLKFWRARTPIDYQLINVHIDLGYKEGANAAVNRECSRLGLELRVEKSQYGPEALTAEGGKNICFHCARKRRNRLFSIAGDLGCNKIAFGHHKDDLIETFFLNLLYSGNLSTMVPNQALFSGSLHLIRPLAYLDKAEIINSAAANDIRPVKDPCPHGDDSRRTATRKILKDLDLSVPGCRASIFAALANPRQGYLLRPGTKP